MSNDAEFETSAPATTGLTTTTSWTSSDDDMLESQLELKTVLMTGYLLLPTSLIFTFINIYFLLVIYNNWRRIRDSLYVHSYILCIMLTLADLFFCVLVAFPAGLHMTFFENLMKKSSMKFYTEFVLFFLLEYLFILRVIIVGVLAADKCLHLTLPLRYGFLMDMKKVTKLAVIVVIIPLLTRVIPNGIDLYYSRTINETRRAELNLNDSSSNPPKMTCIDVSINRIGYPAPLTCEVDLTMAPKEIDSETFIRRDIVILFLTVATGFLVILICDVIIGVYLVVKLPKLRSLNFGSRHRSTDFLSRTLCTWAVSGAFALTNFPYAFIRLQQYRYDLLDQSNGWIENTTKFIIYNLMFLSLFFHPWIYLLKMKSIRELVMWKSWGCVRRVPDQSHPSRLSEASAKKDSIQMRVMLPAKPE